MAFGLFIALAVRAGVPTSPDGGNWQQVTQLGLLGVIAAGGIVAPFRHGVGGSILSLAAVALGALASFRYHPLLGLGPVVAFLVPGVLYLVLWQRTRPPRSVAGMAVALIALLAAGGFASAEVYDFAFGPTHPQSTRPAPPPSLVEWVWSGGVTETSATVTARLARPAGAVRLLVSDDPSLSDPVAAGPVPSDEQRVVSLTATRLRPDTRYWYALETEGQTDTVRKGSFRTFAGNPTSFTLAVASCARTGSNGRVYDTIRELGPDLLLLSGDFFYADIGDDDPAAFRSAYDTTLTRPAQADLYRSVPIAYVWDDHDYGPNDADGLSPSRDAARQVYRQYVPHYPLPSPGPIYQAFSVGRTRFILTDTRSARSPKTAPDGPTKTMLGAEQRAWLERELLAASGRYPLIVWVNPDPWISPPEAGADHWGGYSVERAALADFIAGHRIQGLLMISGDAHMVAIDDGSNNDYSSAGGAAFPVFHAAALDRRGSTKGGPYSEGAYPGSGQFGVVRVTDDGGPSITVELAGYDWTGAELVSYRFTVAARGNA